MIFKLGFYIFYDYSFRESVTSYLDGSLLNWTAENRYNVCSSNGVSCRNRTKKVVAIILLPGLQGSISPSLGTLSLLRNLNLSDNSFTGNLPLVFGQLKAMVMLGLKH